MAQMLVKLFSSSIIRYLFIGGVSFLVEIIIIFIGHHLLNMSSVLVVSISFWTGLITSFILQKIITFKNTSRSPKKLAWQAATYALLVIVNYLFTIWFVSALESQISIYIARTIALVITTIWNYFIYSKVIFKK